MTTPKLWSWGHMRDARGQPANTDESCADNFIIVTDDIGLDAERELMTILRKHECSWWRWLNNTWLVRRENADKDPEESLIAFLKNCQAKYLVLRVDPRGWAFGCPASLAVKWRHWLVRAWSPRLEGSDAGEESRGVGSSL